MEKLLKFIVFIVFAFLANTFMAQTSPVQRARQNAI